MKVLVTAASKHGATDEIAARIGADLVVRGLDVTVCKLSETDGVADYDAVVVGSAVYFGRWQAEARTFLEDHATELAERPTWLFASGPIIGDPPPENDPKALRPGLADELVELTQARGHRLFAGRVDTSRLDLVERLTVRMVGSHDGDHRDWDAVDAYASEIADALVAEPVASA